MKMLVGISAALFALSAPAFSQAITNVTALQNGSCEAFGSGWSEFAFDGVSNITYCKQVSDTVPATAVVDLNGIYPGHTVGCTAKFGAGWSEFAYDGTANIRFCKKIGDTAAGYVSDVSALIGNGACEALAGRGWDTVVFNGRSNISFCAKFK
ncbi:MAG TPA: hypothetical protein VE954_14740 [Oligoflexus sp.]|uniref:hypothetical protein n=1 Tax=Oligoflexus sp. TaxID=1971216 RepID=UPI002D27C77B|nr:hypothetical protein [Oligoflexus sp.]HYX34358.1 hypothetical protein [Oligoflexus sp.]